MSLPEFISRERQLAALYRLLAAVAGQTGPAPARTVLVGGRRRVGKSRLVEEFLARALVPHVYLSAAAGPVTADLVRRFVEQAAVLPVDEPSVLVIDDLPAPAAGEAGFEPALRKYLETELSGRQILLIVIGIDPFTAFGPGDAELLLEPLTPSEIGAWLQLSAADAFEAYLVTGGLPQIVAEWPVGAVLPEYLDEAVRSPTSALVVSGERVLAAEFPSQAQARLVLAAIGSGARTFANIGRAAGNPQQGSLSRALTALRDKHVVAADVPLSALKSSETRYRVADPDLGFWLAWIGPHLAEIERGRGDLVLEAWQQAWPDWRARAVQPVLREALDLLLFGSSEAGVVGAYWTRSGKPEIDVVIADRAPIAERLIALGSIKWRDGEKFGEQDYGELLVRRTQITGTDERTSLFAVSRSGASVPGLRIYSPEELLDSW
jgi:AAA+ ATPase superfamily predicted ATPase